MEIQTEPVASHRRPLIGIGLLLLGGVALYFINWHISQPRFSDEMITETKQLIRDEFEKQPNVHVPLVVLVRDSDRKLSGFAKVETDGIEGNVAKFCIAVIDDNKKSYWTCP
jgi:hypothetical protein